MIFYFSFFMHFSRHCLFFLEGLLERQTKDEEKKKKLLNVFTLRRWFSRIKIISCSVIAHFQCPLKLQCIFNDFSFFCYLSIVFLVLYLCSLLCDNLNYSWQFYRILKENFLKWTQTDGMWIVFARKVGILMTANE